MPLFNISGNIKRKTSDYDVTLTTEWSGFGIGYKIYRIDICMETGNYCFIDSNETTIKSGVM